LPHFLPREEGQGLAEYALILSIIVILCVAAVTYFGSHLTNLIHYIGQNV
jgi:Flp pilus assembly pilin Flp